MYIYPSVLLNGIDNSSTACENDLGVGGRGYYLKIICYEWVSNFRLLVRDGVAELPGKITSNLNIFAYLNKVVLKCAKINNRCCSIEEKI